MTLIVAGISLFGRPEFAHSAIWAVDAVLTAIYVLWPISLGVGAVPVIRLRRTASRALLEALPTGAQWRAMVTSAAWPGIWICAGLVLSSVLALGVAAVHGSPPSWQAVAPLAPALAGTVAMSAMGGALAVLMPTWVLPPLLVVASFAGLVYDVAGLRALTDFVGATGSTVVAMQHTTVLLALCAGFGALVVASLAVSAAVTTGLRRWWLVGLITGVAGVLVLGGTDLRAPRAWADDSGWPCTPVPGTNAEVCLPPDQRALTDTMTTTLTPIVPRLVQLDPALSTSRFSPSAATEAAGGQPTVWITLPVGRPETAAGEVMSAITAGLAVCWDEDTAAGEELAMARAMVVLQWWLTPELVPDEALLEAYGMADRAPTQREAEQAYDALAACGR